MTAVYRKLREFVPFPVMITVGAALIALCLQICFYNFVGFADFFNENISPVFRSLFAYLTGWIPFSLAEAMLISLPVIAVVLTVYCCRRAADSWRSTVRCMSSLVSVLLVVYILFVLTFGAGYRTSMLDDKIGIDRRDVSAEQLYNTAVILNEELLKYSEDVLFSIEGHSVMPYGYDELNRKLLSAYDSLREKYPFLSNPHVPVKTVMLSELMTYTHISGVYSFFTGEANLNVNFPDYVNAYTMAHEMAHQRGIAREDEANFIAFLVCLESDDSYIKYSAYLNMFEYVSSALYRADRDKYNELSRQVPSSVVGELVAYEEFFKKYEKNVASTVTNAVNNTYLVIQGTPGTKSYGMVVDLCVAFYGQ